MKRDPLLLIDDILESIALIQQYTDSATKKTFLNDRQMQDAIIRRLEIIGESVKNIPANLKKKHISIPWKQIAGMRDKLVHFYFGVNAHLIWQTIHNRLPALKIAVRMDLPDQSKKP
jgi:uncharacterized protein with HEPN domain